MTLILSGTDGLSDVDGSAATPAIRGTDANTGMFFPAADTIAFSEGGVEALRINSSGTIVLSGGDTTASGTGITFPATQSASSNANTLDDYEEGTWTPQLRFSGVNVGMTGTFSGRYTKVGNMVTVVVYVAVTNKGSSTGGATLANLPFAPATTGAQAFATCFVYVQAGAIAPGAGNIVSPNLNGGTNTIDMNKLTIATGVDANCNNTDFAAAGAFWLNATYIAA
jgi:hypothetical protein